MAERTDPSCLRKLDESEILGERMFQLLIDHARSPRLEIGLVLSMGLFNWPFLSTQLAHRATSHMARNGQAHVHPSSGVSDNITGTLEAFFGSMLREAKE